jgi:DNA-binding transcriptional MerR regulator
MSRYTVKQLARLSGVSVRTLHHYDEIGLLRPAFVGENRYRYYGREELLRLQDILFHRELGCRCRRSHGCSHTKGETGSRSLLGIG